MNKRIGYLRSLALQNVAILSLILAFWFAAPTWAAAVTLVRDSKAAANIVTPAKPSAVESYAATELQYHVQQASGATLPIVNESAALPAGATSNLFRTRDALLDAVVERFAAREKANWDDLAARTVPASPAELATVLAEFALAAVGPHRTLTLARYVILVEAAHYLPLRERLLASRGAS